MLNAAFVVLRELAELLLISLAVLGCVGGEQRRVLRWLVPGGAVAGIALGCMVAALLRGGTLDPRLQAMLAIVLGGATLWMALTILFSSHSVREYVETVVEDLPAGAGRHGGHGGHVSMAMLSAFCVFAGFRESMEVWLFLEQAAEASSVLDLAVGAAMGAGILLLVLAAFRPLLSRLRWLALYRLSTVGLCFVSIKLLLGGVADLMAVMDATRMPLQAHAVDALRASATAMVATLAPTLMLARRWWRESSAT